MMATMCHLNAATVWQSKPIILHVLPPKGRQVREYIAVRSSHLLGVQMHVQGRGSVPSLSSKCLAQKRDYQEAPVCASQTELTRDVWDLDDDQFGEGLEALQTKMA